MEGAAENQKPLRLKTEQLQEGRGVGIIIFNLLKVEDIIGKGSRHGLNGSGDDGRIELTNRSALRIFAGLKSRRLNGDGRMFLIILLGGALLPFRAALALLAGLLIGLAGGGGSVWRRRELAASVRGVSTEERIPKDRGGAARGSRGLMSGDAPHAVHQGTTPGQR